MTILRVIDFETSDLDGEVIEVGLCDYNIDTGDITPLPSYLCHADNISVESRAVHHIWKDDLEGLPKFDAVKEIERAVHDGVLGFVAHKMDFEAQWIQDLCEGVLPLFCSYKAALRVFDEAPKHSNFGLAYWIMDKGYADIDRSLMMPAHRAGPDSYVTANLLKTLFEKGMSLEDFAVWSSEPAFLPRIPMGKHKGALWSEIDADYLSWIVDKSDLGEDLKFCAQRELAIR